MARLLLILLTWNLVSAVATAASIDKINRTQTKFVLTLTEEERALVADKKVVFVLFKETRQSAKAKVLSLEELDLTVELEKSPEKFDEEGFVKVTLKPIKKNFLKVVVLQTNEWGDQVVLGVPFWMIEGMEIGSNLLVEFGRSEVAGTVEEITANRVTLKLSEQALDLKKGRSVTFVAPEGVYYPLLATSVASIYLPRGPRIDLTYASITAIGEIKSGETSSDRTESLSGFALGGILHFGEKKDIHLQVNVDSRTGIQSTTSSQPATANDPAETEFVMGTDASLMIFGATLAKSFGHRHHLGLKVEYQSNSGVLRYPELVGTGAEQELVQSSIDLEQTTTPLTIGYAVAWTDGHFALDLTPSASSETVVDGETETDQSSNLIKLAVWQTLGKDFHLYADVTYNDASQLEDGQERPNVSRLINSHMGWHYWLAYAHNINFDFFHQPASYDDLPRMDAHLGYGYRSSSFDASLQAIYTQTAGSLGEESEFNIAGPGFAVRFAVKLDEELLENGNM